MEHTKTASQRLIALKSDLCDRADIDMMDGVCEVFDSIIKQVEFLEKSVERQLKEMGYSPHKEE